MGSASLIDIIILALLGLTIGYCVILSRRMERLHSALLDLGPALDSFSAAVDRSEQTVADMRSAGENLTDRPSSARKDMTSNGTTRTTTVTTKDALVMNFYKLVSGGAA